MLVLNHNVFRLLVIQQKLSDADGFLLRMDYLRVFISIPQQNPKTPCDKREAMKRV